MKLTEENYFSKENNMRYTGSSQIKDFIKCEACAMAKLNGEWEDKPSPAMIVSSYIDAAISGTLDTFKAENPDIFKKDGNLKSEYVIADKVLQAMQEDKFFYKYLQGEHQVIMTGEIENVPVKIKIDSFFKDKVIVDLKAMRDLEPTWNNEIKMKQNFINQYDYVLQGALYQEIARQNTGKTLPFIIAVTTKEEYPERALLSIPQNEMDEKLGFIKSYIKRIQDIKTGKVEPIPCNKCDYCKSVKKTTKIYDYNNYFEERG